LAGEVRKPPALAGSSSGYRFLQDESQDAVTSTFMFHELPPKVRRSFSVNSRAC
jgi:hypothetical protein